ncbi:arginase family protein [Sphaerobacter thermophilus]|jgi:arginase|uniref:arginase family protein n=1 Tax=Sphaerobacter thermophilus TaxID=2057 RepID=UPI0023535AC5
MDLHVVQIHYGDGRPAPDRELETTALQQAGVYDVAGGDVTFATPVLPEAERDADRIVTLGRVCGQIAGAVADGIAAGRHVVVTGGNCSHLPGVIGGLQQAHGPAARIGLVWFDAHGDFNTPRTTLSGMLGGMPVAVSAGLCYAPWRELARQQVPLPTDRIVMVDVRNLDPDEERLIHATDVEVTRDDATLAQAVARLAEQTDLIYLHVDLDVLDASLTPTHPTKEPNGLDIPTLLRRIEIVMDTGKVGTFGLLAMYARGAEGETTMASAIEVMRGALTSWRAASKA